jgi:D-glycero-D-manno-heptose 1,7-bisphosphate phosphatase
MNNYLYEELPIDKIYVCVHSQNLNCKCRKPKTYFFKTAIKNYKIDPKISFMVGDRKTDILAGNNIGCKTIFINRSYLEDKPSSSDRIVRSFSEAVNFIYKFK